MVTEPSAVRMLKRHQTDVDATFRVVFFYRKPKMLHRPLIYIEAESEDDLDHWKYPLAHVPTLHHRIKLIANYQRVIDTNDPVLDISDGQDPVIVQTEWEKHQPTISENSSSQDPERLEKFLDLVSRQPGCIPEHEAQAFESGAVQCDEQARLHTTEAPQESVHNAVIQPHPGTDCHTALCINLVSAV